MIALKRKMRVVELYAGAGRSSDPFRLSPSFEIALLADISERARDIYLHNHPKAPYAIMDLEKASIASIERAAGGKVDILIGCPPCQGFSESGLRDQLDPRNEHIVRFAKIIKGLKPRAFVMENVPLAALSDQFKRFSEIVSLAGYECTSAVLNAAEYGSVQSRQRLVVIGRRGHRNGIDVALPKATHMPIGLYFNYNEGALKLLSSRDEEVLGITSSARRAATILKPTFYAGASCVVTPRIEDVIDGLPNLGSAEAISHTHTCWEHSPDMLAAMKMVPEGGRRDTGRRYFGAAYARLHRYGLAKTITRYFSNAGSGRFWHPLDNRSLTPREAARVQGFDDSFAFPNGNSRATATIIGNALDKALAEVGFSAIQRVLG